MALRSAWISGFMPNANEPKPGTRSHYHYNTLADRKKRMYERIRKAMVSSEESVTFAESMTVDESMELIESVLNDNPQIFWLKNGCEIMMGNGTTTLRFIPNRFAKEREKHKEALIKAAKDIHAKYVANKSDAYAIELAVHDLFASYVKYDGTDDDSSHSIIGPLLYKRGVCEGIAKAAAFLLNAYGVDTSVIFGRKKSDNVYHAWNVMKIGANWYLSDITLDIQDNVGAPIRFYLNMDDAMASRTHVMKKPAGCNSKKNNYYVRKGTYFKRQKDADRYLMDYSIEIVGPPTERKLASVTYDFYVEEDSDTNHYVELLKEKYRKVGIGFGMSAVSAEGRFRITLK